MKIKNLAALVAVILIVSSCVKDEVFVGPASISNVTGTPASPQSTESVVVSAKVTDLKGISSVKLYYKASTATAYTSVDMTSSAEDKYLYSGTIPAFAKDVEVWYYIEVVNSDNLTTVYPETAPLKNSKYTVGASNLIKLFINEVFPDGTKDATDPDWVEIYNDSEIEVNLGGYAFYDEGIKSSNGSKPKRIIEDGLKIPAKGFLVIKAETYAGTYTVEFGLSTSGDAVYLENKDGVLVASLDFLTIATSGKKSYGRKPDGSSTLTLFTTATKGTSNNNAN
jgi:hypothetical protein